MATNSDEMTFCAALLLRRVSFPWPIWKILLTGSGLPAGFFLTEGERQQVINWLMDELGVNLNAPPPEWAG